MRVDKVMRGVVNENKAPKVPMTKCGYCREFKTKDKRKMMAHHRQKGE